MFHQSTSVEDVLVYIVLPIFFGLIVLGIVAAMVAIAVVLFRQRRRQPVSWN
jgi:hypothetical protein